MPSFTRPPRGGKGQDPIAALFVQERNVVLSVVAEQHVPHQDAGDLVNSTLVAVLSHVARGRFVPLDDAQDMRAVVRAYLCTTARRIVWEQRHRERMERDAREPHPTYDPTPMFEARSDLRALDLPPVAAAFFQAIVHEGHVYGAAKKLGWRTTTAYARRDVLRQDALAALRRIRGPK
jgi:hypothetical protein